MRLSMEWIALANPSRFLALAERLMPWLAVATALAFAAGLYAGFFLAPGAYPLCALGRATEDPARAGRAAAGLTRVGAINLPIIKFSVDWWNTLHQPASLLRVGAPTIHPAILAPLLVMGLAFLLLFAA